MNNPDPSKDLLRTAKAIGEYTGDGERRTNYLLDIGALPAFKLGGVWHLRKSVYQRYIEGLEAAALTAKSA